MFIDDKKKMKPINGDKMKFNSKIQWENGILIQNWTLIYVSLLTPIT